VVSHALAKGAMFLAAGWVLASVGHDRIEGLAGLARRAPVPAFAFAVAGVSMLGLPPSGGFVSKWLYVTAALQSGAWWWAVPVLVGGLLAGAYIFRVVAVFMRAPSSDDSLGVLMAGGSPVQPVLAWVPLGLAVASLLVGVLGQPVLDLLAPAAAGMASGVAP
jgi:formate hydrogenlyase subunit 3/multisubunit Na+/H+ antiporter MnhD subunit